MPWEWKEEPQSPPPPPTAPRTDIAGIRALLIIIVVFSAVVTVGVVFIIAAAASLIGGPDLSSAVGLEITGIVFCAVAGLGSLISGIILLTKTNSFYAHNGLLLGTGITAIVFTALVPFILGLVALSAVNRPAMVPRVS